MNTAKKWFLLNSGGGAVAITPNIYGYSKNLTTADIFSTDSGASTYTFERDTDSGFGSPTEVQSGASKTLNDTGLTGGVTYYYRVKGDNSEWSQALTVTTIPYSPVFWIEATGARIGTNNDYAITTASNADTLKSIINTAPVFNALGTKHLLAKGVRKSRSTVWSTSSSGGYRLSAGSLSLGTDWTLIMSDFIFNSTAVNHYMISQNGVTADNWMRISNGNVAFQIGGVAKTIVMLSTMTIGKPYDLVVKKRVSAGNTLVKVSNDGGVTYSAETSFAGVTADLTFDQIFISGAGVSAMQCFFKRMVVVNQDLSLSEIALYNNYMQGATFVPRANTSTVPKGITFPNTLPADGIIVNSELDNVCTASYVRDRSWVVGDYLYQLCNKKEASPYFQQDVLYVVNLATGMYSDPIELPIYNSNASDVHASGSIPPPKDNTLLHLEQSAHYDVGDYQKLMVRKFGDSFDMSSQTGLPFAKGIDSEMFVTDVNYWQTLDNGNTRYNFCQEFNTFGQYIAYLATTDNYNSGEYVRILDSTTSTTWFYHKVVYREDGVREIFVNSYLIGSGRFDYLFAIRIEDNGKTWENFSGSFTQDVSNNTPITKADLISNCVVLDASALAGDAFTYHVGYDPSTDETFGLTLNGTNTAIQMFRWSGGSWNLIDVDFGATSMNYSSIGDGYDPHFFIIKTGANSFDVYAASDNSGDNQIVKVSTTDNGSTWGPVSVVSTDDTSKFQRFYPNRNVQYSTRKVVVGSVEVSSTEGSLFVKEL